MGGLDAYGDRDGVPESGRASGSDIGELLVRRGRILGIEYKITDGMKHKVKGSIF